MWYVFFFLQGVTFNWSVLSTSCNVDITAGKQPRQSDRAKTNHVNIHGLFTHMHFLFSSPYSCDFPIITPFLVLSLLSFIWSLISLKQQSLSPHLIPHPLSLLSLWFFPQIALCPSPDLSVFQHVCLPSFPHFSFFTSPLIILSPKTTLLPFPSVIPDE